MPIRSIISGRRSKLIDIEITDALLADAISDLNYNDRSHQVVESNKTYTSLQQVGAWLQYARRTFNED